MTSIDALDPLLPTFEGMANRSSTQWRLWRSRSRSVELLPRSGAVLPGELATDDVFHHEQKREELKGLTRCFATHGLSWSSGNSIKISAATEYATRLFLDALPSAKALPEISPDGEGGLLMVWERDGDPLLITVDDLRLHAVIGATTPRAHYFNDIPFDRPDMPQAILDAIPGR